MRLEHYSASLLKTQIRDIVGKYLDLNKYRIFIFGSRVSDHNSERSDIDIGIQGPQEIPGNVRIEILEELDSLPLLYKFDVVDFAKVTPEFKAESMKNVDYVS